MHYCNHNLPISIKVDTSLMLSAACLLKACHCRTADLALKASRYIIQAFCSSLLQPVRFGNLDCMLCRFVAQLRVVYSRIGAAATQDGTSFQHFKPHTTLQSLLMLSSSTCYPCASGQKSAQTTTDNSYGLSITSTPAATCCRLGRSPAAPLRPCDQHCQSGRHDLILCV